MYRLTALVFLLAAVFSHASADGTVQLKPALPAVKANAIRGLLNERADQDYCDRDQQYCEGGWCCPSYGQCCQGDACCPEGEYCVVTRGGYIGCCPQGQICSYEGRE